MVLEISFFDPFPTPKHFSEYQKRFLGRSNPRRRCYLEIEIFEIFGHYNMYWSIWNFDPQNRPLKTSKPPSRQKSKNPFFSANTSSIETYGVSKVAHGYFWPFPAYRTLKMVFAIFVELKYGFFTFFDEKTSFFKSTKTCWYVQKSRKSQNRVYTHFLP